MGNSIYNSNRKCKVLFCGTDHFVSAFEYTKECVRKMDKYNCIQLINCKEEDFMKEMVDTAIVLPFMFRVTKNIIEHAPHLKLIMQFGVGLEGVDIAAATSAGIHVSKIDSWECGNAASCAEHAIYLALACLRNTTLMQRSVETGIIGVPTGRTLFKSNIMIYGYGNISKQILQKLLAFEPNRITVVDKIRPPELIELRRQSDAELNLLNMYTDQHRKLIRYVTVDEYEKYAGSVDMLFICVAQNPLNKGFVNVEFLSKIKSSCVLINVCRGGLLNYVDVLAALNADRLHAVGTDVFEVEPFPLDNEFLKHPKVVCTPHVAGVTELSYRNMAEIVADNVMRVVNDLEPTGLVNSIAH